MFKSKLFSKFALIILTLITAMIWLGVWGFPKNNLKLVFCDVGQGDAVLISQGFNQVLIDGGPDEKVLTCLSGQMPMGDQTIEVVVLTHPESDHLTGLISVLDKYQVDFFFTGPEGNQTAKFDQLIDKLNQLKDQTKVNNIYAGEKIKLGDIVLTSIWPEKTWLESKLKQEADLTQTILGVSTMGGLNDYRGHRALLMADADSKVQKNMIISSTSLPIDILKLPHHGSKTGIAEEFLSKINPKKAVISVGKNSFGHPTQEILDLLAKYKVEIKRTDQLGTIVFNLD